MKTFFLLLLILLGLYSCQSSVNEKKVESYEEDSLVFDKNEWKKLDREQRHYMVSDLIENHLTIGMDSLTVKELLGAPLPGMKDSITFSYELGYYRDLDPVYLVIYFNLEGKVKAVKIDEI